MPNRTVFFVSDGTGITAETFGNSILAQFSARPRRVRRPFIDTAEKARSVVQEINLTAAAEGKRPIVFLTLVREAEAMMKREGIAWLSSTHKSIEEIATTILRDIRPDRLIY